MKRYALGLVLGLIAVSATAQDAVEKVKQSAPPVQTAEQAAGLQLPDGVITEQNPLKLSLLARSGVRPALFRPSDNMPDIVNEDLLRGMTETAKAPNKVSQFIGYVPRLKVLPCAKGCEGKDYDRAVQAFVKGFRGDAKYIQERGEMIVQVRWFNVRPFLQRHLPYGADLFGVSFMLEGKVVSLGKKSGVGVAIDARDMARDIGARLGMELLYTMGVGARSTILSADITPGEGFGGKVMSTGAAIDGMLGVEDVRSRIEPATEANANLLPAIDGIKPNEIAPIAQMYYLNSWLF